MIDDNSTHILAFTTLDSEEAAMRLVRELVKRGLVACGTAVTAATSVFRWDDSIREETEVLVILKTQRSRWADLEGAVVELHPYDLPELIAVPVAFGLPPYLEWITQETQRLENREPHG